MRYWDASALVPLVVEQRSSGAVRDLYVEDPVVLSWTLSEVEILAALARLERDGALAPEAISDATQRLRELWDGIDAVVALDAVKARARRLLRTHALRAPEAMQLGAALLVASDDPPRCSFVCLDDRLRAAAGREGFALLP